MSAKAIGRLFARDNARRTLRSRSLVDEERCAACVMYDAWVPPDRTEVERLDWDWCERTDTRLLGRSSASSTSCCPGANRSDTTRLEVWLPLVPSDGVDVGCCNGTGAGGCALTRVERNGLGPIVVPARSSSRAERGKSVLLCTSVGEPDSKTPSLRTLWVPRV